MKIHDLINDKIQKNIAVDHLQIINESHMHAGPATESHFRVIVVSCDFSELNSVARHRKINQVLAEEMGRIHALALNLYTPEQWKENGTFLFSSPKCTGSQ